MRSMCSGTRSGDASWSSRTREQAAGSITQTIRTEFDLAAGGLAAPPGASHERVRHRARRRCPPPVRRGPHSPSGGRRVARTVPRVLSQRLDALATELARGERDRRRSGTPEPAAAGGPTDGNDEEKEDE